MRAEGFKKKLKVFIVEDHTYDAGGFQKVIESDHELEFCGRAATVKEFWERIPECSPNAILIDLFLPESDLDEDMDYSDPTFRRGLKIGLPYKKENPAVGILFTSLMDKAFQDSVDKVTNLGLRGIGFLQKTMVDDCLSSGLKTVAKGEYFFDPNTLKSIFRSRLSSTLVEILTPKQREILAAVARGNSAQEIAIVMARNPKTINGHIKNIAHTFLDRGVCVNGKRVGPKNYVLLAVVAYFIGLAELPEVSLDPDAPLALHIR